jgi:hypothetical protein
MPSLHNISVLNQLASSSAVAYQKDVQGELDRYLFLSGALLNRNWPREQSRGVE